MTEKKIVNRARSIVNEAARESVVKFQPLAQEIGAPLFDCTPIHTFAYLEWQVDGSFLALLSRRNVREFLDTVPIEGHVIAPTLSNTTGLRIHALRKKRADYEQAFPEQYKWVAEAREGNPTCLCFQPSQLGSARFAHLYFYGDPEDRDFLQFIVNNSNMLNHFSRYLVTNMRKFRPHMKRFYPAEEDSAGIQEMIQTAGPMEQDLPDFLMEFNSSAKLSPRQKEMMYWYLQGKSLRETADLMGVKYNTAKTQLNRMQEKLNCRSKAQILVQLLKEGMGLAEIEEFNQFSLKDNLE